MGNSRAFQWSGCKERCLCPVRLAGPVLHPPQHCLLGYYTFTTQSAQSKRSCSNPCKSRLHWRKWLCSVHKCQPCVLTWALEAPKTGYAIPPGCEPGYWVRLATGEALFWEGEEVGVLANPREPPCLSACCLCADMKAPNVVMIHERWNFLFFFPSSFFFILQNSQNEFKTLTTYVNMSWNICKVSSRLTCS